MNLTAPPLVMHYAPGVLVMLKRESCPGQKAGFGGVMHSTCGCEKPNHQIFKVVNISIIHDDETQGLLERNWIRNDQRNN